MKNVWCFKIRSHFCSLITQNFIFDTFSKKCMNLNCKFTNIDFYTDLHFSHKLSVYTIQNYCFLLVNSVKQLCSLNKKPTNCLNVLTSCLSKAIYFLECQISKVLHAFSIFFKGFQFYIYSYNDNNALDTIYSIPTTVHITS